MVPKKQKFKKNSAMKLKLVDVTPILVSLQQLPLLVLVVTWLCSCSPVCLFLLVLIAVKYHYVILGNVTGL